MPLLFFFLAERVKVCYNLCKLVRRYDDATAVSFGVHPFSVFK